MALEAYMGIVLAVVFLLTAIGLFVTIKKGGISNSSMQDAANVVTVVTFLLALATAVISLPLSFGAMPLPSLPPTPAPTPTATLPPVTPHATVDRMPTLPVFAVGGESIAIGSLLEYFPFGYRPFALFQWMYQDAFPAGNAWQTIVFLVRLVSAGLLAILDVFLIVFLGIGAAINMFWGGLAMGIYLAVVGLFIALQIIIGILRTFFGGRNGY